jgi:uncharacterized protein
MAGITPHPPAAIYAGTVLHQRLRPFKHRLRYRVYNFLLDIDALPQLAAASRLFRYNRFGLFGFYNRDHGPRDGSDLRPWVEHHARHAGVDVAAGKIYLLCYPRVLGYVFNPISVYFLYDRAGVLRALIYQVRNTFGGMHSYFIKLDDAAPPLRHRAEKIFHVSPFLPLRGEYHFQIHPPAQDFDLLIRYDLDDAPTLIARHQAARVDWSERALWRCFWRYPLLTLKVILGIHYEAVKIFFRKNSKFYPSPPPPALEMCYYQVMGAVTVKME